MADPLLPGDSALPPDPSPAPRRSKIQCEFCECDLVAASGDVLKMSEKAKAFRGLQESLDDVTTELATAREAVTTVTRERDEARGQLAARTKKSESPFKG